MNELICFTNANYGDGRGLELVPLDRIELFVSAPPYITHTKPGLNDGIGDMTFLFKYRAAAGNPEHGNIPWLRAQLGDLGTFSILRRRSCQDDCEQHNRRYRHSFRSMRRRAMKRAITCLGTEWVLLFCGGGSGICGRRRSSSRATADRR